MWVHIIHGKMWYIKNTTIAPPDTDTSLILENFKGGKGHSSFIHSVNHFLDHLLISFASFLDAIQKLILK